jgi:hypothetical protein
MDDLEVFGTLIDVCGARYGMWPNVTCHLLAGHDEEFHCFERYDAAGDVVESYAWRMES